MRQEGLQASQLLIKSFHLYCTWLQPQHAHLNWDHSAPKITQSLQQQTEKENVIKKAPNVQRSGSSKGAREVNFSKRSSTRAATPLSCSQWRASNNWTDVTLLDEHLNNWSVTTALGVSSTPSCTSSTNSRVGRLASCTVCPPNCWWSSSHTCDRWGAASYYMERAIPTPWFQLFGVCGASKHKVDPWRYICDCWSVLFWTDLLLQLKI